MRPKEKQILEAGLIHFLKFGFKGTSIDDIAKAAGVGKGTVYNYFENKEELFTRVVNHHEQKNERAFARQWKQYKGKDDPLIMFFIIHYRRIKEDVRKYNITLETFLELIENYQEKQGEKIESKIQDLINLLIQGVKDGRYQPADHRKQAMVLFELSQQYLLKWIKMNDSDMEKDIRDVVSFFLTGILV